MTLTIHPNLIQGSEEWLDQRRGLVTASAVGQLLSHRTLAAVEHPCPACETSAGDPCVSKRNGAPIKASHPERVEFARQKNVTVIEPATGELARGVTLLLAAERITGWTDPTFMSDDMLRGIDCEPIARSIYHEKYAPVTEVGFMVLREADFTLGYSPDGLVGEDGLIEVKSPRAKNHLNTILDGSPPINYMPQLQAGLLVSGRKWIDYVSYVGGMPLYVTRVYPEPQWFSAIKQAAITFERNVDEIQRQYRESVTGLHPTDRIIEQEMVI